MKQKVCTLKVFEVMNLRMMLKNVRNKWKGELLAERCELYLKNFQVWCLPLRQQYLKNH